MDKKTKALCLRASVFGFAHLLKSVRVHSNMGAFAALAIRGEGLKIRIMVTFGQLICFFRIILAVLFPEKPVILRQI
ncbi:hypothetical protein B5F34_11250 [Mediterranea sp. An20]|uniref:hypothetical protein n=1 Tax=Mediterranea sp. An20 TaxID=1965586 RepID=UPI000B3A9C2D|nr:hypothetical protein [Mediterranea sp. An20]OUP07527.1 hypothetical protein B5F34_11250 [Mediterranea sp. An20]